MKIIIVSILTFLELLEHGVLENEIRSEFWSESAFFCVVL
jgi:hypothetical protein